MISYNHFGKIQMGIIRTTLGDRTCQRLARKAATVLAIVTATAFGFSGTALAGNKFANVKATAECTLNGTGLTVTAGIEVTKTNTDQPPFVGDVKVVLEEHTAGTPGWPEVFGSMQMLTIDLNSQMESRVKPPT